MKTLGWLTDIHLSFLSTDQKIAFLTNLSDQDIDSFLITGDLGEGRDIIQILYLLDSILDRNIFFVLGNHDYYYWGINEVRSEVVKFVSSSDHLFYLSASPFIPLTRSSVLLGHDSWADARNGDYDNSTVFLADYSLINDFLHHRKDGVRKVMEQLAQQGVDHILKRLNTSIDRYTTFYIATHVPPSRDACWHEGRISTDDFLPHFSSKLLGEEVVSLFSQHPDKEAIMLCGHTHSEGTARLAENVTVLTGKAIYGSPELQKVFTVV